MDMDVMNGNEAAPKSIHDDQHIIREKAMLDVLNMNMMNLKYILDPVHEICCYLSIGDTLQEFSCTSGHTFEQYLLYESIIRTRPRTLPAKTFLETYFMESNITLRVFMQALLRMENKHTRLQQMVMNLWNAALYGNSPYFSGLLASSNNL